MQIVIVVGEGYSGDENVMSVLEKAQELMIVHFGKQICCYRSIRNIW